MCGIFAIFGNACERITCNGNHKIINKYEKKHKKETLREEANRLSKYQRHRGPDKTGIIVDIEDKCAFVHERLRIVGVALGDQPLQSSDGKITMVANGEIYNYLEISDELSAFYNTTYVARSDCDVIIGLYEKYGDELVQHMTGMYAFALYDKKNKKMVAARDPFGIIPYYIGSDLLGNIYVASEMKCLTEKCSFIQNFPPGHILSHTLKSSKKWNFQKFFDEKWMKEVPTAAVDLTMLRQKLEDAVRSHLQCEVNFGALLSGGVDSSLIASIATKIMREKNPDFRLKTFSVGLEGAPDFKYAQMVADHINSDHHEITFTIEEGLDCIRDIIYHLESYDVTTIRASIPMFILARRIKSAGLKMVLSGEGADEIFGGYLYFHNAPDAEEFHKETVSRVMKLHESDCLRANKSMMAWGVELRVPFLDTDFVNYTMSIRPEDRMITSENKIEKKILRAAFDGDYLPHEVLWRQKEQFSDGVGYDWINTLKQYAESHVSDEEFGLRKTLYSIRTPLSKEGFYIRELFEEIFSNESCVSTVSQWIPRQDWGCSEDPSGRSQKVHVAHKIVE